ncbi:MAG: restriction endonuclease [Chrysiogenetes bacterium]|nr:restriction endonuclease [Chrysiogenetes bacterium]
MAIDTEYSRLSWSRDPSDVVFRLTSSETAVPLDEWGNHDVRSTDGKPLSLAPLFSLLEDERIEASSDTSVAISDDILASLASWELRALGLPERVPYMVELQIRGDLLRPGASISLRYVGDRGRVQMGIERDGCFLKKGDSLCTLSEPLFSLVQAIENYGKLRDDEQDERFAVVARIKQALPEGARIDDQLQRIQVVLANAFELQPFLSGQREPDFHPRLGRIENPDSDNPETASEPAFQTPLPDARQEDFARQFRQFDSARGQYALGGATYVIASPDLQKALNVLREIQKESVPQRRAFLQNPHAVLRERLQAEMDPQLLETLFHDEGYSERVRGIGIWEPVVLPWITQAKEPWLPPEEFGLRIDDRAVYIKKEDLKQVESDLRKAHDAGASSIEYLGQSLPVTPRTLESVEELVRRAFPEEPRESATPSTDEGETPERVQRALLIKDNLGDVEFEKAARRVHADIGTLPPSLRSKLHPHQAEALQWLQCHWADGSPGALLADDMGLGKTVESLSFLAWVAEEMRTGTHAKRPLLIVAPTGLLKNWEDEHTQHLDSPGLGHGLAAFGSTLRQVRQDGASKGGEADAVPLLDLAALREADWVLTTYETLRDYQFSFGKIHWGVIVFDETQKIKNPGARVTGAAKAMKADFLLALTGTPVENRLGDLWCIVDMLQPGKLGSHREFSEKYEVASPDSTPQEVEKQREILAGLGRLLKEDTQPPMMLRRLKGEVLGGLPSKEVHCVETMMPELQCKAYDKQLEQARAGAGRKGAMLEALHGIRSTSLHPYHRDGESDEEYISASARLTTTFNILDQIHQTGERALIFVESRDMQGTLAELIQRRYKLHARPLIINGTVSGAKRKAHVDEFQQGRGFDAMILSPKAGGVGLTLTAANHVIHLSRWWNPAVEDQCTDRVFRIGQKKPVHVYYPIAVHPHYQEQSFDWRLHELLESKRALSRNLLAPTAMTDGESKQLLDDLIRSASDSAGLPAQLTLGDVDRLEPLAFEDWVADELRQAGFSVKTTPRTGDRGCDLIALAKAEIGTPNLLIQCKHRQTDANLGEDALVEIMKSVGEYDVPAPSQKVVITNAKGFTAGAKRLATGGQVTLIARDRLRSLRKFPRWRY